MERTPGGQIKFSEALRLALQAFLTEGEGSPEGGGRDSTLGLLLDAPSMFGLEETATADDASAKLKEFLSTDADAEVVLLTQATIKQDEYRFTPEYGESIEENWTFRIRLPTTLDVLIWSIVDRTGKQPAYCYAIE